MPSPGLRDFQRFRLTAPAASERDSLLSASRQVNAFFPVRKSRIFRDRN